MDLLYLSSFGSRLPAARLEKNILVFFRAVRDLLIDDLIDRPVPGRLYKPGFMKFRKIALLLQTEVEACIFRLTVRIDDFMRDRINTVEQTVCFYISGKILLRIFLQNKSKDEGGQHGTDRHTDDHSADTEKSAPDQDRDKDHKARDTD